MDAEGKFWNPVVLILVILIAGACLALYYYGML